MASWAEFAAAEPALAQRVRERLDAGTHKTLATLRRDGAPRVSGNEAWLAAGELWFGVMPGAVRAADLRRDPRYALHTASGDPPGWAGDATLSGRAEEVDDLERRAAAVGGLEQAPEGPWHLFRADLSEVLLVVMGDPPDHIVVTVWHPGAPPRSEQRR
jgi:hypothetical protein